jgi:hypothetical protein
MPSWPTHLCCCTPREGGSLDAVRVDPFGSLDLDPAGAYVDGGIEIRPWAEGQGQRKMRWANAGRRLDGLIMLAAANVRPLFLAKGVGLIWYLEQSGIRAPLDTDPSLPASIFPSFRAGT